MALQLKFAVATGDCASLKVTDVSGVYSNVNPTNLTGWGLPNVTIGNSVTATLTITTKDTAIPYVVDVYPTLPNITGAIFTVTPAMIGYTTSIPTQVLKIIYTVTGIDDAGNPFTYKVWCLILVGCALECCVSQLMADAALEVMCKCPNICDCSCSNKGKSFKAMQAFVLLYGLKQQVKNKLTKQAEYTLSVLQNICNCK